MSEAPARDFVPVQNRALSKEIDESDFLAEEATVTLLYSVFVRLGDILIALENANEAQQRKMAI